jgi:hypothetical protein
MSKEQVRALAREEWCNDELQIDPDATVSYSEESMGVTGAWVQAWVYVRLSDGEGNT